MLKVSLVLHGKISGKRNLIKEIDRLSISKYDIDYYETKKAQHAEQLTVKALEDGCDYLIAVGGDGTLNEVVNGYLHAGGRSKFNTVLGVLPWGTGNDFVRSIGIKKSISQLFHLLDMNSVNNIDAGEIRLVNPGEQGDIRYFDNIADLGIGAEIVAQVNGVHLRKKIFGGTVIFFFTAIKTFLTYRHKKVRISWDGFEWEGPLLSLVVANGRFFGSGLGIAPGAKIDDGIFQVIIFGGLSVWDYLKNYGKLRRSELIDHPEVYYLSSDYVKVETEETRISVEADGEVHGQGPLELRCLKAAIPFLIP